MRISCQCGSNYLISSVTFPAAIHCRYGGDAGRNDSYRGIFAAYVGYSDVISGRISGFVRDNVYLNGAS